MPLICEEGIIRSVCPFLHRNKKTGFRSLRDFVFDKFRSLFNRISFNGNQIPFRNVFILFYKFQSILFTPFFGVCRVRFPRDFDKKLNADMNFVSVFDVRREKKSVLFQCLGIVFSGKFDNRDILVIFQNLYCLRKDEISLRKRCSDE